MVLVAAVVAALIVGFVAGLLTFKKSEQYCPSHGVTKTCPECMNLMPGWAQSPKAKSES